jgi:hypothetical protein
MRVGRGASGGRGIRPADRGIVVWQLLVLVLLLTAVFLLARQEWNRLARHEMQREAQVTLREIATRMKAYRDAHGAYTTDLVAIGFAPANGPRYVAGFTVPHYPAATAPAADFRSHTGYVELKKADPRGPCDRALQKRGDGRFLNPYDLVVVEGETRIVPQATDAAFLAGAAADLDGDPGLDVWMVGEDGWPVHVVDDGTDRIVGRPGGKGLSDSVESARAREQAARQAAMLAQATARPPRGGSDR